MFLNFLDGRVPHGHGSMQVWTLLLKSNLDSSANVRKFSSSWQYAFDRCVDNQEILSALNEAAHLANWVVALGSFATGTSEGKITAPATSRTEAWYLLAVEKKVAIRVPKENLPLQSFLKDCAQGLLSLRMQAGVFD